MTGRIAGRPEVERLIANGRLQLVPANRELAHASLDQARAHLRLASAGVETDPVGSFQLAYDAARKALTALLIAQGLRPTTKGGHVVAREATAAQFADDLAELTMRFEWMRRLRNHSEYPSASHPVATVLEATKALEYASATVEKAGALVGDLEAF